MTAQQLPEPVYNWQVRVFSTAMECRPTQGVDHICVFDTEAKARDYARQFNRRELNESVIRRWARVEQVERVKYQVTARNRHVSTFDRREDALCLLMALSSGTMWELTPSTGKRRKVRTV